MPSFGGANIFGVGLSMRTADRPRETQVNTFFGLSGLETLDGGMRGRTTLVNGLLSGTTAPALAAAEATFRSYNDGLARTLVDNLGVPWRYVRLLSFEPLGRIRRTPTGVFFRSYHARFLHLV